MFSLPLGPARLRRPEIFFRYTFKHFLDGLSRRSSLPDPARLSVVPIESVAPGDVQVLAARESGNVKTLVTDLDVLANFPSVESVVASTAVRANRDLSQIRELLILTGTPLPDAATLRHLKGLHTLYTLLASGTERLDLG